VDFILNG
jgi:hypothetical protein